MKTFHQFIGPDGETPIARFERHPNNCSCEECQQERWMQAEQEEMQRSEKGEDHTN